MSKKSYIFPFLVICDFWQGSSPECFPGLSMALVWPRDHPRATSWPGGVHVIICGTQAHLDDPRECHNSALRLWRAGPRNSWKRTATVLCWSTGQIMMGAWMGVTKWPHGSPPGQLGVLGMSLDHTNAMERPEKHSGELLDQKSQITKNWKKKKKTEKSNFFLDMDWFLFVFFSRKKPWIYIHQKNMKLYI